MSVRKASRLAAWAVELTKREIEQVVDLHKNDQGFRDYNGATLAAGWLRCPATPERLADIPEPGPGASMKKIQEFEQQIEDRRQYALRRVSITNGYRFQCPALAGTVGCPLRAITVDVAAEGGLPVISNPPQPGTAPTCCTQATVELKEDGQRKFWQREYWGSKRWRRSKSRRSYIEGVFGNIKNPSAENLTAASPG